MGPAIVVDIILEAVRNFLVVKCIFSEAMICKNRMLSICQA